MFSMRTTRPVVYALILITILLLVFTLPGEKGLIRSYQLYQELNDLQSQNATLKKRNQVLAQEASMLKDNLAYIEHVIIQEMNLVKPGDIIVVFKKEKK
jgi:cell division protein FtsB